MTNNTIKRKIKRVIEENNVHNRVQPRINKIRLKGIKQFEDGIEIQQVTISIDNPKDIYLGDVLYPLDELDEDGICIISKMIEC